MSDRPKISVIIATSNSKEDISQYLDSVLDQSLRDIEVIMV